MKITYSECVLVALGIQHANTHAPIIIGGLPGSTVFFHITSYTTRFSFKKNLNIKMRVLIFCTILFEILLFLTGTQRDTKMCIYKVLVIFVRFNET
jgi:hypothetical protein